MANLEDLGEVISTDVLIVGGGIGGLSAALKAKEYPVDVLVVEKQTVGWAGVGPKVGGGISFVAPEDDPDKFVENQVRTIGHYLNDQELLYAYARETYSAAKQLADWGANVARDPDGKMQLKKHPMGLWSGTGVDIDLLTPLRNRAHKLGVKIINKVQIVDLLKDNGRVTGAVGFNIVDGSFHIIKAKATVLANAGCEFKNSRLWSTYTGDGIAAAYRAGAEMRNAELGTRHSFSDGHSPAGGQFFLFNALGENISKKYMPVEESDYSTTLILGVAKEIEEGRGPVYIDLSQRPDLLSGSPSVFTGRWYLPKNLERSNRVRSKVIKYGQPTPAKPELFIDGSGTLSCVRVDHDMKTNLDGLFAIGDTSYAGSAWAGAVSVPPGRMRGSGIGNALFSGLRGGPAAARFASQAQSPSVNYSEVKQLKEDIFTPLKRDNGIEPDDILRSIQDVVFPVKYTLNRRKERMEEALIRIEEAQRKLPELRAKDTHYLGKCHEVKNMVTNAEMIFRSALMRTESRGSHYREDYPSRDDKNWLKWIIVKRQSDKMALFTEPVPIEKYRYKP